jgi:DNA-binding IclR family transcriptional regulator
MTNGDRNGSGKVIALDRAASGRSAGDNFSRGTRGLSTARAALRVLSFMSQHPEGVTARQVAEELGKSISTAYGLLASLYEEGFAFCEPGRGYRLCAETPLGPVPPQPSHGTALSQAVNELFARTRRRSYLGQVEAGAIVITAVCGRQGIPRVPGLEPRIGRSAHALAMGKVVLSLLPHEARQLYIEGGLRMYTPRTITSPEALMSELDEVRSSGFAVDRAEFDVEYCSVAAPIPAFRGRFLAVLGLTTSSRTFETEVEELVDAVREVAAAVSGDRMVDPRVDLSLRSATRGQQAA